MADEPSTRSLEALSERATLVERMADVLHKYSQTVTESRKRKLDWVTAVDGFRESLHKRARGFGGIDRRIRDLDEEPSGSKKVRSRIEERLKKIEAEEERLRLERESLAERKQKVDFVIDTLNARIDAVEEKEEKCNSFVEGKMREISLKEEKLEKKLKEFAEKMKLADAKFREHGFLERIELAEGKLDEVRVKMDERFEEIELRGNAGWESLALSVKEAEMIGESVEKKLEELEKRKQEFSSFQEEKTRELASKEKQLDMLSKQLAKDAELRNEQLMEHEKLLHQLLERLRLAEDNVEGKRRSVHLRLEEIGLKMQEMASKEQQLKVMSRELVKDAELRNEQLMEWEKLGHQLLERLQLATVNAEEMRGSVHEWFEEIGLKMQEMASKEQQLDVMCKELAKDAELRNEQLMEQEKSVHQLLARLQSAKDNVEGIRESAVEKLEEIGLKMRELASQEQLLNSTSKELVKDAEFRKEQLMEWEKLGNKLLERLRLAEDDFQRLEVRVGKRSAELRLKEAELHSLEDWIEKKMDKADLKEEECEEREQTIRKTQDLLISKEDEIQVKEKSLWAWQKELEDKQKEVDLAQKTSDEWLEKLDARDKNVDAREKAVDAREKTSKEFTSNCFKEHRDKKRALKLEKDELEERARDLALREEHLKELELRLESQQQQSMNVSNVPFETVPDESVDIKFIVRMDGKTLQIFLNDPEKDLGSMGDEILQVLQLSSDPAKLVLDAMEGFYPPHLREGDLEPNVRRTCIVLLEQLCRMSSNNLIIKPHVKEEAIELARNWKLKMRATAGNVEILEVIGFLFVLTAYDLTSYFEKDEISRLMMMLDEWIGSHELQGVVGLAKASAGSFISSSISSFLLRM